MTPIRARPIDEEWLDAIDAAARTCLGPHDRVGAALADEVARLSELYTRGRGALRTQSASLAARLRFFLPRDLPKMEGPLAELAHADAHPRGEVLRVLDLGAGLGASSLAVATFAKRNEVASRVEVRAVERDERALDVLAHLAARCGREGLARITTPVVLEPVRGDLERLRPPPRAPDLVLFGFSLNELFLGAADPIVARAELLCEAASWLAPGGAVVVLEPALKGVSRDLQRVREMVIAKDIHVFAPCTHRGACPLLERERDWCHEDLPLALPERLAVTARAAGLRWEGLSYSYLVLRAAGAVSAGHRVVGGPVASKGKTEWQLCGGGGLVRLTALDRERDALQAQIPAGRGTLVRLEGAGGSSARLGRDTMATIERTP